jgi:hypothetical protein
VGSAAVQKPDDADPMSLEGLRSMLERAVKADHLVLQVQELVIVSKGTSGELAQHNHVAQA